MRGDPSAPRASKLKLTQSNVQATLQGAVVTLPAGDLVAAIKADLADFMRLARYDRLAEAVGRDAASVTAEPWPT